MIKDLKQERACVSLGDRNMKIARAESAENELNKSD